MLSLWSVDQRSVAKVGFLGVHWATPLCLPNPRASIWLRNPSGGPDPLSFCHCLVFGWSRNGRHLAKNHIFWCLWSPSPMSFGLKQCWSCIYLDLKNSTNLNNNTNRNNTPRKKKKLLSKNSVEFDVRKMWILWKMRL